MSKFLIFFFCGMFSFPANSQLTSIQFLKSDAFAIEAIKLTDSTVVKFPYEIPFYTLRMDDNLIASFYSSPTYKNGEILFLLGDSIDGTVRLEKSSHAGLKYTIRFTNMSSVDHQIENLVPLGTGSDKVYITAEGTKEWPDYLCRSKLFRPGYGLVGVILPDNAWHLGFADLRINDTLSLVALARRTSRDEANTKVDRWG